MPFVNWTHVTPYTATLRYYIEEIRLLNKSLLEAGLIDYTGSNTNTINTIADTNPYPTTGKTGSYIASIPFTTLYYRLPVGDNSITVDNEEIISEGYSDVPCYLKIRFYLGIYVSGNMSITWSLDSKLSSSSLLCAGITVSTTENFNTTERNIVVYNTNASSSSYSINGSGQSYNTNSPFVSLGANSLVVSWMDSKLTSTSSYNSPLNSYTMPRLMFSIYRNDGILDVMVPYTTISNSTTFNNSSYYTYFPRVYTYINDSISYTTTSTDMILQDAHIDYIPVSDDGRIYSMETYGGQNVKFRSNPTLIRTTGLSANASDMQKEIVFTTVRIKYKGHIVKLRYIVYGHLSYYFRWRIKSTTDTGTIDYRLTSYLLLAPENTPIGG